MSSTGDGTGGRGSMGRGSMGRGGGTLGRGGAISGRGGGAISGRGGAIAGRGDTGYSARFDDSGDDILRDDGDLGRFIGIPAGNTYLRIRGRIRAEGRGSGGRGTCGSRGGGSYTRDVIRSTGTRIPESELSDYEDTDDDMPSGNMLNDDMIDNTVADGMTNDSMNDENQISLNRNPLDSTNPDGNIVKNKLIPVQLWFSSPDVVRVLSKVIKGAYHRAWLNWSETDDRIRKHWYYRFKNTYNWDPEIEQEVWDAFNKKAASRLKDLVNKAGKVSKTGKISYFMSEGVYAEFKKRRAHPDFVRRSKQALSNRLSGTDHIHIDPGHRQGSISTIELTKRMAKENDGVLPSAADVYLRSHSKKSEGDQRILMENKKVKGVMEMYNRRVEELSREGIEKSPDEIYYDVVGGHKKGAVPGLGDGAELFYGKRVRSYKSSCTPSLVSQINHYRDEANEAKKKVEDQESRIQVQDDKIKDQESKIEEQGKKLEDFEKRLEEYQLLMSSLVNEGCKDLFSYDKRRDPPNDPPNGQQNAFTAY